MADSFNKITLPKLKGTENYIIWTLRAKAILTEKGYNNALLYEVGDNLTLKVNNKALSLIKLLCKDRPLLHLRSISSAKEAWEKLENLYNPKGFTIDFLILRELFNTSLGNFNSIEELW